LLTPQSSGERWCLDAELLLFYADRAQHVETVIKSALRSGQIVLLDRFEDSTRAYQGVQGVSEETLVMLRQIVLKDLRPNLTLLFDADPEKMLTRVDSRNREKTDFAETRFDHEALCFHRKVRERFLEIASREPERIRVIPADESPDVVADNTWSVVAPKLNAAGFLLR
jgi:dTMP kinase